MLFTVPILLSAQENSTTTVQTKKEAIPWDKLTRFEQAKRSSSITIKGSRKIDINPVPQNDGIKSGGVIAYGHFIKAPFVIQYIAHKLIINGVQVEPSLIWEREYKAKKPVDPKLLELAQRQIDVSKEIKTRYRWHKLYKSNTRLKEDIIAFAKSKEVVLDAKWDNDAFLISFAGGTGFEFMELESPAKPFGWKKRTRDEAFQEAEQSSIETITKDLRLGGCVGFQNGSRISINDPREKVNKILKDSTLTYEKKADLLSDTVFLGNYDVAFDVLENYNPKEWQSDN